MNFENGEPTAKLAQLYLARDAACKVLEDLSERQSLVVLNGTEAELENHTKQQFRAQRVYDTTIERIKALSSDMPLIQQGRLEDRPTLPKSD